MSESANLLTEPDHFDDEPEFQQVEKRRGESAPKQQRKGADSPHHHHTPSTRLDEQKQPEPQDDLLDLSDLSTSAWQEILWHEWRNTNDEEYAAALFELIANEPVGRKAIIVNTLLGILYGALIGTLSVIVGALNVTAIAGGILLGALLVWFGHTLFQRRISTQDWLAQLTGNLAPNELGMVGLAIAAQLLIGLIITFSEISIADGSGGAIAKVTFGVALLTFLGARLAGWMFSYGREPNPRYLHQYRKLWFWWRGRPLSIEVETGLQDAIGLHPDKKLRWTKVLNSLAQRKQKSNSAQDLIAQLRSIDWITRFTATHLLIAMGGQAVPDLKVIAESRTSPLRQRAINLLRSIELETQFRLAAAKDFFLCPTCLTFCSHYDVVLTNDDFVKLLLYGCRTCRQSQHLWPGEVVAVLDTHLDNTPIHQNGITRVNWTARRELFDFHSVEIKAATDEDVERFAVQIGNDTEPIRRPRYQHMSCVIISGCELSENTLRILRRTFSEVTIELGKT